MRRTQCDGSEVAALSRRGWEVLEGWKKGRALSDDPFAGLFEHLLEACLVLRLPPAPFAGEISAVGFRRSNLGRDPLGK